jgi:nicotinamide mononucleotide transporter
MSFFQHFWEGLQSAGLLEYIAVCSGILSVWFSKKENVWVYPIGLINTIIYIYLSAKASLFGESVVNGYYTIMSLYGWWIWLQKDNTKTNYQLKITFSDKRWLLYQSGFFLILFALIFVCLFFLKDKFYADTIPWADGLASASAFTGMWLMTRKKVESWYWWIMTNIISVPLFIYKGYALTGIYYFILLVLAISGLHAWKHKATKLLTNL